MNRLSLPQEVVSAVSKMRVILLVCGVLLVITASNCWVYRHLTDYPSNRAHERIVRKWRLIADRRDNVDWLILGDSTCHYGVDTELFTAELRQKALNLCTVGDMITLDDVWMLGLYIKKYGPPKGVLLVHAYDIWHKRRPGPNVLSLMPPMTLELYGLNPPLPLTFNEKVSVFVQRYLPLYSKTHSIRELIRRVYRGRGLRRVLTKARPDRPRPHDVDNDSNEHLSFVAHRRFRISMPNKHGLAILRQLVEQYDFPLFIAAPPLHRRLLENAAFDVYFKEVQQMLRKFSNSSRNIYLINQQAMGFEADEMFNADHLIMSAAQIYTQKLVEELKPILNERE